jgi:hypothetical protein
MCCLINETACASEIRLSFTRLYCAAFPQTAGSRTISCGSQSPESTASNSKQTAGFREAAVCLVTLRELGKVLLIYIVFRNVELRIFQIFVSLADKTSTVFTVKMKVFVQSKSIRYHPTTEITLAKSYLEYGNLFYHISLLLFLLLHFLFHIMRHRGKLVSNDASDMGYNRSNSRKDIVHPVHGFSWSV